MKAKSTGSATPETIGLSRSLRPSIITMDDSLKEAGDDRGTAGVAGATITSNGADRLLSSLVELSTYAVSSSV